MQQVQRRRPQTLLCLQGVASRCGGFPSQGQVPNRMVPLTRDGGARENGVMCSLSKWPARDLRVVIPTRTYSTRDSALYSPNYLNSPFHMIDRGMEVAHESCILDNMVSTGQPLTSLVGVVCVKLSHPTCRTRL